MANLPTNFKDDILDTSVNTRRRYRVYENTDGTIELEDVTEYSQVGDEFGAGQINAINTEVNKKFDKNMIVRDLDTINAITKEGYVPDALALKDVNDSLATLATTNDIAYSEFGTFNTYLTEDRVNFIQEKNGMIFLNFSTTASIKNATWTNLGTINEKYRPIASKAITFVGYLGNYTYPCGCKIDTDGTLSVYQKSGADSQICCCNVVYPIK